MYKLEKSSIPLYVQLYTQIKNDISNSQIKAGEKLPSIRSMVSTYNVSKNTIENAYNQLFAEGYIQSIPQKGFFVSEDLYQDFTKNQKIDEETFEEEQYKYDFYPACLNTDNFPKKLWQSLYTKVLNSNIDFGTYPNCQGELNLRVQVAKYLQNSRGVNCTAAQIVLCSGFADSMFIVSSLLKNFTSTFSTEALGYRVAKKVFELQNYKIDEIPITNEGIDIKKLQSSETKLLYITPSHQYLTGATIPISNRIKLINWAKKNNSYIIEDDYDSELSFYNRPIPALQSIDENDRVIYSGTFSKAFSPALRISYLVLPMQLLKSYHKIFDFPFSGVSLDTQKTLELFIKQGYWDKHIRKIRTLNKKKHDIMKNSLIKYLSNQIEFIREGSGLNFVFKAKVKIDFEELKKEAKKEKIKIYIKYDLDSKPLICLGFGTLAEDEIVEAILIFAKVFNNAKI